MAAFNPPSALDLLLFHRQEREFFSRLIHRLRQRRVPMQWVMSLWLWFESIGHHEFILRVSSSSDEVVLCFLAEANACLRRLIANSSSEQEEDRAEEPLPLTNALLAEPIGLRFFDYHRQEALNGVVYFLKNVSEIIFDDDITKVAAGDAKHFSSRQVLFGGLHIWRPSVLGSMWDSSDLLFAPAKKQQHSCSTSALLNPMATPWTPVAEKSPEDHRSLFITFSRGYPLTRDEIKGFFDMRIGRPCVETVMIERAAMGVAPIYGRVVFTAASVIVAVLRGRKTAKFMIKGRHLWARMYVPRNSNY